MDQFCPATANDLATTFLAKEIFRERKEGIGSRRGREGGGAAKSLSLGTRIRPAVVTLKLRRITKFGSKHAWSGRMDDVYLVGVSRTYLINLEHLRENCRLLRRDHVKPLMLMYSFLDTY